MTREETRFVPLEGNRFRFACHPGVPCFTECCRDLNLLLTPYDILRLRKRLGMRAADFLETHTEPHREKGDVFPKVRLRMSREAGKPCPFVTPDGCRIYEDRPSACRIYPLGRATAKPGSGERAVERFFLVRETHCRGFEEDREWSVEEWTADQGLEPYLRYNDLWSEIVTRGKPPTSGSVFEQQIRMFYMASYELDMFRRFVFESSFLDSFQIAEATVQRMREDDEALLEVGLQWLHFALFGEERIRLRKRGPSA